MSDDSALPLAALSGLSLHEAKRAMRGAIIAARDGLAAATRERAGRAIGERLRALPSFRAARCILATLPFRGEWDTRPVLAAALAAGKKVALPRVNDAARMLDLHTVADLAADTMPGYRAIPEPRPERPRLDPAAVDWVLVPGVAFDPEGKRLGYGGGYYDRLLALLRPETARVAGAFDLQVVPRVPAAPHDLAVDVVVTETRSLVIRA
jgi:5-formyltetrahydrofolate cyclo-ligase